MAVGVFTGLEEIATLSDGRREVLGHCVEVLDPESEVETVRIMLFVKKGV